MKGARFNDLVGHLRQVFAELPDRRQGKNLSYAMEDFGLSAFSVFFTQSHSFLAHQRTMPQARGHHNAQSFFHVQRIPCDNQIRQIVRYLHCPRWQGLLRFMMRGLEIGPYAKPT